MSISALIQQKIEEHFMPSHFEIVNESDKHLGHAGHDGSGESHFKLIIVSDLFGEYNRIQRNRLVYSALDGLFDAGLHALSLELFVPFEYKNS